MKIRIWTAIVDHGDGSHGVKLYPSRAHLVEALKLDHEDFSPYYDIPIEVEDIVINANEYMMIEE